jgi:hypothetical protein
MDTLRLSLCLLAAAAIASGQWLNRKTPGVPRLDNGALDMMAPAPRLGDGQFDLNGLWWVAPNETGSDFTRDLKSEEIAPWARKPHKERPDSYMIDSPHTRRSTPATRASVRGERKGQPTFHWKDV